jgi:hypothetical protein
MAFLGCIDMAWLLRYYRGMKTKQPTEEEQMKLTASEHTANAEDWVGCSNPGSLSIDEIVDRDQLISQLIDGIDVDDDDVEEIANAVALWRDGGQEIKIRAWLDKNRPGWRNAVALWRDGGMEN